MSAGLMLRLAVGMAHRNGRALAQSVWAQYRIIGRHSPDLDEAQRWEELLNRRAGWQKVRAFTYAFRDGERLELKAKADALETFDWMATIELRPLTRGIQPEVQARLLKEAVQSARDRWQERMGVSA